jgi:acetyl-CoA hydrolase
VLGKSMMNGIGGSGDFTRSAYMSIFTCPSVAKGGKISTIVPHCSHMDHSEHSVQVVITDQGICNMRTMDPIHRSRSMIDSCAHPDYREQLHAYCDLAEGAGYTPETLSQAFAMHQKFLESGDMRGVEYVMPVS